MGTRGKGMLEPKTHRKIQDAFMAADIIYNNLKTKDRVVVESLSKLEDIILDFEETLYKVNKANRLYINLLKKHKKLKESKL